MLDENPLGKKTNYRFEYDSSLLFSIPRSKNRTDLGINGEDFKGYDIWNCYELSWLNPKGKPEVRILRISYSSDSQFIVESKSLKLYLNSFIMSKFESERVVKEQIEKDLSAILYTPYLRIDLYTHESNAYQLTNIDNETLLDDIDVEIDKYDCDSSILEITENSSGPVKRFSNLLKSNCPITGQPDWASIYIEYSSKSKITDKSLLKYIVSYRNHSGYHESCCEQIYSDINNLLKPDMLIVKCFFTRRGGIDINPIRFKGKELTINDFHYFRQ